VLLIPVSDSDSNIRARKRLHDVQNTDRVPLPDPTTEEARAFLKSRGWEHLLPTDRALNKSLQLARDTGGMDGFLRGLADEVLAVVTPQQKKILSGVPIGVVDSHHPFGGVESLPGGGRCIIFHRGLLLFIHDMSRILVAGLMMTREMEHDAASRFLFTLARKSMHVCLMFLADYHLQGTHFVEIPSGLEIEADLARRAMEKFCVLHEFGHILDDASVGSGGVSDGSENRRREIRADAWAAKLVKYRTHPIFDAIEPATKWRLASPCAFMAIAHFLEMVIANIERISVELGTSVLPRDIDMSKYPRASERYDALREILRNESTIGRDRDEAEELSNLCWWLVKCLWELCERGIAVGFYRQIARQS
jgi:hypothetical protein